MERLKLPKNVEHLYVLFQGSFSLLLWVPLYYEFQKQHGLSESEILGIQTLYNLLFCLLEIPTGWFGDRFGYRQALLWGAIALAAAHLPALTFPVYAGFVIHFALVAVARSLISGSASAYLYSYLDERGRTEQYSTIEGNGRSLSLLGRVVGWIFVGFLAESHLEVAYILTLLSALVATVIALQLPDLAKYAGASAKPDVAFTEILRSLRKTPLLALVMFQGVGLFVMVRIAQINLYQPILASKGIALREFGWILSIMTVCEALGSARLKGTGFFSFGWMRNSMSEVSMINVSTLVVSVGLAALALSGPVLTVVLYCVICFAVGVVFPVQRKLLNDVIPAPEYRATLLSVESIVDRLIQAGVAALAANFAVGPGGMLEGFLVHSAWVTAVLVLSASLFIQNLRPRSGSNSS